MHQFSANDIVSVSKKIIAFLVFKSGMSQDIRNSFKWSLNWLIAIKYFQRLSDLSKNVH